MDMRNLNRPVAVLLLLVLAAFCPCPTLADSEAAPCEGLLPEQSWTRVDTEHFRIEGGVTPNVLRSLAVDLEHLRDLLVQLAPSIERRSESTVLFQVFPGVSALEPYWPVTVPPGDPGFLLKTENGALAALGAEKEIRVARQTAFRQYLHHLLTSGDRPTPLWLRYGLVEMYTTFEVRDGVLELGRLSHTFGMKTFGLKRDWLPLEQVTAWTELPENRDHFIAESFIFLHYLMVGQPEDRRTKLPELVRALLDGANAEEAFRSVYGVELELLNAQMLEYLEGRRFSHLERPVEPWTGSVSETPMPDQAVLTDLGHLLLHARETEVSRAETHYQCALELAPEHGPAWRGLGRIAELREDDEAARSHYRKALEEDPLDARTLERLGNVLLRSVPRRPTTDEETQKVQEARAAFLQSLEIEPHRAETWADLGRASLLLRDTRQEAVDELTRAAELLPDRPDVVSNLLLAHAQVGDRDEVEALYERLLEMDAEPGTLARAQEVRYQLDFQLADALVKSDRPDDAVALYAQILTGTRNPQLATLAAERLELMARAETYNQFVELYQEASQLLDSPDPEARADAAPVVEALEAMARPGLQLRAVRALQERLEGEVP